MVNIHTYDDVATATRMASEAVRDTLAAHKNVPILFLVAGGSSMSLLPSLTHDLFDARVTMGVLDERFSTDPTINNYAQLAKTDFYGMAVTRGVSVIETLPKTDETIDDLAERFGTELKNWRISHADGVIIALQGIGPDSHTAGMMPYPDDESMFKFLFEDPSVWVVGYDASFRHKYPLRVTVTMPFLRMTTTSIVYAVGEDKKKALTSALAPTGELYRTPARIIHEMPHCLLYTDQSVGTVNL
jgi:6-phosphogluconolactonase/glucosamine-6-phosphate isomerase/deaminase